MQLIFYSTFYWSIIDPKCTVIYGNNGINSPMMAIARTVIGCIWSTLGHLNVSTTFLLKECNQLKWQPIDNMRGHDAFSKKIWILTVVACFT